MSTPRAISIEAAVVLARRSPIYDGRMERLIDNVSADPRIDPTDEFCNALAEFAGDHDVTKLRNALGPLYNEYGLCTPFEERLLGVLGEVRAERRRQHEKRGQQDLPSLPTDFDAATAALKKQVTKAMVEAAEAAGTLSFHDVLFDEVYGATEAETVEAMRAELIQVAAVAVAWVEAIDRRAAKEV